MLDEKAGFHTVTTEKNGTFSSSVSLTAQQYDAKKVGKEHPTDT